MDIRITRARRVFSDGNHNAFTGIAAAHGKVFITFRSGTHHMIPDGAIKVIGSTDMETWQVAAEVRRPGVDLRDPKAVVWGEKLMVFCGESRPQKGCRSLVIQSSDGVTFGEPVPLVGIPDGRWLWHVRAHGDKLYGTAYTGWPPVVSLYSSHDGLTWELASDFPVPGDEVYLDFDQQGILWALVRDASPGAIPALCTAEPPYSSFRSVTCLPMRLEGPMIKRLDGGCVIVCRQSGPDGKRHCTRTDLFWLADGCDPRLVRTLPSGGDTSYAGWLDTGPGRAVLSYYSSHEHKMAVPHDEDDNLLKDPAHAEHSTPADIFLADVSYQ